jgi:hypothetical protein
MAQKPVHSAARRSMTNQTNSPGTRLSDGGHSRAALEEAMAKHEARQKWRRPLVWISATVILAGVVMGVLFIVLLEDKSVSLHPLEGDPHGVVLRAVVGTVSEHIPLGSRLLSHRYREPNWHSCSPNVPAGYSDVAAQFVYYIPPSDPGPQSRSKQQRWVLLASSGPYSWNQNVTVSAPNGQNIQSDASISATVISRSTGIWAIDASSAAFGEASSFCGGPD